MNNKGTKKDQQPQNGQADLLTMDEQETKPAVIESNLKAVDNSPDVLLQMAVDKNLDMDKLERLMEMKERHEAKIAKNKFLEALSGFQSEMETVSKGKNVNFQTDKGKVNYNYATLDMIADQARPLLKKYGLSYRWKINDENKIIVTCIVSHVGGHSEENTMSSTPDVSGKKNEIQSRGSAVTYLQRYTLIGSLGITTGMDNDGGAPLNTSDNWKEEIQKHTDFDALRNYGNSHSQKKNPEFISAMNIRLQQIKEGK